MSILIKGMNMPIACYECRMYEADIYYCGAAERDIDIPSSDEGRCSFCPLVEVPTPHGRLIDANELLEAMYHRAFETDGDTMWQSGCWVRYRAIEKVQDAMPTIIEAEEE